MLIKPERQSKCLSIDEFKLHNSHRYATHMIKNFNDKMVSEVRKDSESLKKTRYILMSSREPLQRKDREAADDKALSKGGILYQKSEVIRRPCSEEKHDQFIRENKHLHWFGLVIDKHF